MVSFRKKFSEYETVPVDAEGVAVPSRYMGGVEGMEGVKGDFRLTAIIGLGEVAAQVIECKVPEGYDHYIVAPHQPEPIRVPHKGALALGRESIDVATVDEAADSAPDRHAVLYYDHRTGDLMCADIGSRGTQLIVPPAERSSREVPPPPVELLPVSDIGYSVRDKPSVHGGDDAHMIVPEYSVMAVFDGVGGDSRGGEAARTSARYLEHVYAHTERIPSHIGQADPAAVCEWLKQLVNGMSQGIYADQLGMTTASVAQVVQHEGKTYVSWANLGDSRLYLKRGPDVYLLTTDDGEGHVLGAAVGTSLIQKDHQTGYTEVGKGDILIACTDGIIGDYFSDVMTSHEMAYHLQGVTTPGEVTQRLTEVSRKNDDKTVIAALLS